MAAPAPQQEGFHDCRDAWARTLEDLAARDPRIVAVVNDSVGSSKLGGFQKTFPERLVNVGIAEQNMVGVGAGLANGGKIPFVSAASCFLSGRALEQIKADIAYARFNVKLVGQSSGVAYGELGPTHHSIEDFAWLRPLDAITVIAPADAWETEQAVRWAAAHDGPVYIRLSRMPVPDLTVKDRVFRPGKAEMVLAGSDLTLIACGTTVHLAAQAAATLRAEGISVRLLNMATLNPLDEEALAAAASQTGAIVTVEEAHIRGGLGGAVAEFTAGHHPVPVERLGFPGFVVTGSVNFLFEHYGITPHGIIAAARRALARKQ
ncbi:transketolase family protein [Rhizobium straminoryzae]|uniref:Transketolase family protein n=1 Tax=Rhizobium straminoryzae TaxID=1387186 RepID=A0A549T0B5_9HYPH|nr:transketolase C-terminal domain-containing protein [Rhizobium straminoryzae]TRL35324.1 transketolase family protein [Rhizobium straminoryzae]